MGKAEAWVVIDLRPLIKGYHYWPRKYLLNDWVDDLIKRYDILIIPKTELEPTPNYDLH